MIHLRNPLLAKLIPALHQPSRLCVIELENLLFFVVSLIIWSNKPRTQIPCINKIGDLDLASGLASEATKRNAHLVQREEAMKKCKELLFTELCQYLALKGDEVKKKWRKMEEEDKWVLVKGFISEWSESFHPLSARFVKEMVEEYLQEESPSSKSSPSSLFPGLRRMMGFS